METIFYFVVLSLAVYRLSIMLVDESGPFDIFDKLRYAAGIRYDQFSQAHSNKVVGKALLCVNCTSVWVAFAACIAYAILPTVTLLISMPFAVSSVAILIYEYMSARTLRND
jgi:hypothetical protein